MPFLLEQVLPAEKIDEIVKKIEADRAEESEKTKKSGKASE